MISNLRQVQRHLQVYLALFNFKLKLNVQTLYSGTCTLSVSLISSITT